jgi:preprotein translocase subunit SecB
MAFGGGLKQLNLKQINISGIFLNDTRNQKQAEIIN